MKKDRVVTMDNNLVRASYQLTLNEIRLLLVAIAQMPKGDDDLDPNKPYYVTKDDFVKMGVHPDNVAREIRTACSDLLHRKIKINLGYGIELHTHWIDNVLTFKSDTFQSLKEQYPDSKNDDEFIWALRRHNLTTILPYMLKSNENLMARIVFHRDIVPYISLLKKQFTKLNLDDMSKFSSFYSYRVYFMLMQFRQTGHVQISVDEFKEMLELKGKYTDIYDLKKRVLDPAIAEINEQTSLAVEYSQIKAGRIVTHFAFRFKIKEQLKQITQQENRDPNTVDMLSPIKMTDKQRHSFANKLAELDELGSYAPIGASTADYANKIADDLLDSEKAEFYRPYLAKVGFTIQ